MLHNFSLFRNLIFGFIVVIIFSHCKENEDEKNSNELFEYNHNITTRWSSPENMNGVQGAGGKQNNTAKGHAFDSIAAGATYKLLDIKDMGIINRMWITIDDRSPECYVH
jgi:hypothetical protein